MRRHAGWMATAAVLGLAACGNEGNGPTEASPAAAPAAAVSPVPRVLFEDSGPVPAQTGGYLEFSVPGFGTLGATVDWTFETSYVVATVTTADCDDFFAAFQGRCANITPAGIDTTKPKRLSGRVNRPGVARLWLANLSEVDESLAVQITLTNDVTVAGLAAGEAPSLRALSAPRRVGRLRGVLPSAEAGAGKEERR